MNFSTYQASSVCQYMRLHCALTTRLEMLPPFLNQTDQGKDGKDVKNLIKKVIKHVSGLLTARSGPVCGQIATSEGSTSRSVIVLGGNHRYFGPLSSTEILDPGTKTWRRGTSFPFPLLIAAMVQDPAGGVIVVGGLAGEGKGELDTLYRLAHAGEEAQWEKLPINLKSKRTGHLAMMLPSTMFNCSTTNN